MNETQAKLWQVLQRSYRVPVAPPTVPEEISGDPILPPELEREIFELAAAIPNYWTEQHVGDMALILPQVCRRAQSWIEPLIYERISLPPFNDRGDRILLFLRTIDSRPASFFAANVKYLYFDQTVQLPVIQRVLRVCTGVVSLGCYYPYSSLAPLLAPLPLERLLVSKLDLPSTPTHAPVWTASLTHLGLWRVLPPDPSVIFGALPALTHLAVDFNALRDSTMGTALARLLAAGPHLRCLVLATTGRVGRRVASRRLHGDRFSDPRFYMGDSIGTGWFKVRGVEDLFADAEGYLKRQVKS
ncbi:Zn(2)-C6 fungal-type domain-containing protein [Mycena venus]|uniref:Zn(2)-C6 fungal-type domain-containing protein n=1 Tax=Mycena venus TaxID=2733690 RepID=A0A8H6YVE0_9AGAR|nr:Zn(2)-C6 fungal-type domain-containing protein [Mycena venus]